jgi:hypothetical protein
VINLVCDRALARVALAGRMTVEPDHVLGAIGELRLSVPANLRRVTAQKPATTLNSGDPAPLAAPGEGFEPQAHHLGTSG